MTQQPLEASEGNVLELAAAAHVDGLEFAPDRRTFGAAHAGTNLEQLIGEHGAVVVTRQSGGGRVTWQLVARISVEVYARTYADAWAVQRIVDAHLADRYRPTPEGSMRIDSWRNESAAVETMHPPLYCLVSTWRITTRDI